MKRVAAIWLILSLAVVFTGCDINTQDGESLGTTAIQTKVSADIFLQASESNSAETTVQIKSARFLPAFGIGHPPEADIEVDVFVLNNPEEQAALLDGLDAVAAAISADYTDETVILVTFTASCITYEEEYSIRSFEMTEGYGKIVILYTSTPDRTYADAICPYYAIIVTSKTDITPEEIDVGIEKG